MTVNNAVAGDTAIHSKVLGAGVEDVCNFTEDFSFVEVINQTGTNPLFFTVDRTAASVNGGHTHIVAAVAGARTKVPVPTPGNTTVRVISAGAMTYDVEAHQ